MYVKIFGGELVMDRIEKIGVDDFLSMYVAVSFLQEQRFFNIESLKNYLQTFYQIDDEVINQINEIALKMEDTKMIEQVPNYDSLYKISKNIPFKEIVFGNQEYLPEMVNFFYSFNNCSIPKVKLISEQSDVLKK